MALETLLSFRDLGRMPNDYELVHVIALLSDTGGMLVAQRFLDARKLGANGVACGWVPGHGGDLHWVRHDGGEESCYLASELCPLSSVPAHWHVAPTEGGERKWEMREVAWSARMQFGLVIPIPGGATQAEAQQAADWIAGREKFERELKDANYVNKHCFENLYSRVLGIAGVSDGPNGERHGFQPALEIIEGKLNANARDVAAMAAIRKHEPRIVFGNGDRVMLANRYMDTDYKGDVADAVLAHAEQLDRLETPK